MVFVLCFLVIPFRKTATVWISFVFTIIAIVGSMFVFNMAFNAKENIVSRLYGYPVFRISAVHVAVQLVVCIVICIVSVFVDVPYWISFVVSVILFGVAASGVIITDNTRDIVENMDEEIKVDTQNVTLFQISIAGIIDCCEDENLSSELEKLDEKFRFSDPVSNNNTKESEDKISEMLEELKLMVENNRTTEAFVHIKKITNILSERNRICKAAKIGLNIESI